MLVVIGKTVVYRQILNIYCEFALLKKVITNFAMLTLVYIVILQIVVSLKNSSALCNSILFLKHLCTLDFGIWWMTILVHNKAVTLIEVSVPRRTKESCLRMMSCTVYSRMRFY